MEFAKPYRRRAWMFCLAFLLSVSGSALTMRALRAHDQVSAQYLELSAAEKDARVLLQETTLLAGFYATLPIPDAGDALAARLQQSIDDSAQAFAELLERFRELDLLDESDRFAQEGAHLHASSSTQSADEVLDPFRDTLLSVASTARSVLNVSDSLSRVALSTARERVVRQSHLATLGLASVASGALVSLFAMLLVLAEILNDLLMPNDLQQELELAAQGEDVQARLELLAIESQLGPRTADAPPWSIRVERVERQRRTHTVFEALATSGARTLRLWGRRYHYLGILKSAQRLPFARAFHRGTWTALHALRQRGLPSPLPVALTPLRERRVLVGSLLLAEHIGELHSVRRFVRGELMLLPAASRCAFVEHLASFIHQVHAAGIVGISVRGLQGCQLASAEPRFVLCELDKAHHLIGRQRLLSAYLRRRDRQRIAAALAPYLGPEEISALRRSLAG